MSQLRAALSRFAGAPARPERLPAITQVELAAAMLPGIANNTERPAKDFDAIARSLVASLRLPDPPPAKALRDGAWCLWETQPALADVSFAFERILAGIAETSKKRPYRALASSFMLSFDPGRTGIREAAAVLARKAPSAGKPWADLHARLSFFDVVQGPRRIAGAALSGSMSPTAVLQAGGLDTVQARSGYAKACAAEALSQLAGDRAIAVGRRISLVEAIAFEAPKRLVFEDHGPLVANALIIPYRDMAMAADDQQRLLDIVLGVFGDPRLHPGRWTRMREAEAIVRRWLVRASLRQFLDVVDEVALERMWKYRRAFWEAVYRAELIGDAWVIFDAAGAKLAKRALDQNLQFARFDGSVSAGQAVLLLRVGRGLVAEWSHNGKCIIWSDAEARDAPRMHQAEYRPSRLRHPTANDLPDQPVFAVSHTSPDTYSWQGKVAQKLFNMTNVRIKQSDYMVR